MSFSFVAVTTKFRGDKMAAHIVNISLLVIFLFSAGSTIHCSRRNYALIGKNVSMDCKLDNFDEVYWYKDKTSSSTPLVKIVGGKKTVPKWEEGHYDITDKGALIIYDVKEENYGRYSILCIYSDAVFVEEIVQLDAAIQPHQSCPAITNCSSCLCVTAPNKIHNVTCIINNTRPLVKLSLLLETAVNHTVLFKKEDITYDSSSDTWDSRAMIVVLIPNCDTAIRLRCRVIGENDFSIRDSLLELTSDRCFVSATPTLSLEHSVPTFFEDHWLFAVMVALSLIVLCTFVFIYFDIKRSHNTNRRNNDNVEVALTTVPLLNVEENRDITRIAKDLEQMTDRLIKYLTDEYNILSFIKPLPWGREIHIKHVYTASSFDVITPEDSRSVSSTDFFESSVQDTMKRVIFIAALGHGKSTLQQYLAWKWSEKSKESKNERLLFFLHAKGIDINKGIAEALYSKIPADFQKILRVEGLAYILTNRKCRVVIDGLDEISPNTQEMKKHNVLTPGDIQIKRLLHNSNLDGYPDMQLWVTSRELDNDNSHFFPPFTEIHMRAFTTQQLKNYVENVCKFYLSSAQVAKSEDFGKNNATAYLKNRENNHKLPSNRDPNNMKPDVATQKAAVNMHLEDIEFLQEFSKFPLLMTMFVHIIASEAICAGPKELNIDINSFSSLVNAAKACLIRRYLQKPNNTVERKTVEIIEKRLGMISLNNDKLNSCWQSSQLEGTLSAAEMNIALAIGLLQRNNSKRDVSNLAYSSLSSVEFYHPYIQELIIAQYIRSSSQNKLPTVFEMLIKNTPERNRIARVLQFICGTSGDKARTVLAFLANEGLWDVLVDCYYEVAEEAKQTSFKVINEHLSKRSNIDVDKLERRYHKKAAIAFCESCYTNNVSVECMSFRYSDGHLKMVPDEFTKQITIPKMKQVLFVEMSIGSDDTLIALIRMANDHAIETLGFQNCSFPSNIETPDKIQALNKSINVKVLKINSDSETEEVLDLKKGKWRRYD